MKTIKKLFYSICKIQIDLPNYSTPNGSGFLCKFQKKNSKEFFYTLITSDNVISEKVIEKGEVKIYFNNDNIIKIIQFSESRLYFINKQYGITIIEINDDDGFEFDNFLEIDDNENYENEIYILQYIKNIGLIISNGFINRLEIKENIFFYNCLNDSISCGSPIINPKNNKVIGVHESIFKKNEMRVGFGYLIKKAVNEYIYINDSLKTIPNLYDYSNIKNNNESNINKKILGNIIPNKLRDKLDLSNILGESESFLGSSLNIKPLIDLYNYNNIKEFDVYNKLWNGKLLIEKKDRFTHVYNNNIYLDQYMCVYKIQVDSGRNKSFGTCFLSKFPDSKGKNYFYILVTANHVVSEEVIKDIGKIKIYSKNDKVGKIINLVDSRLYATSKYYDITIIEIKKNDGLDLNNCLEIDDFENNDNEDTNKYIKNAIYMIQYVWTGNKLESFFSKGFINMTNGDNKRIFYDCMTKIGSGGSPVINAKTNKVIGVHKAVNRRSEIGMGTLILFSVKEYINILISSNSINSSLTEKLILLYEVPNNHKEDSLNNIDSYEKKFGITIQNGPINGIKLSNILQLSDNLLNSSSELNHLINSNSDNYNNIEEIDNLYEDNFDVETKVIKFKDHKEKN